MKRFVLFTFLGVIMAIAAVPVGSAAGQFIAGNGTASVLSAPIQPNYALGLLNGTATALPIATTGNLTTMSNDYDYIAKNATGVNTTYTGEYPTDMLISNASMLQLTEHNVNSINLNVSAAGPVSVTIGYGSLLRNTSFQFVPLMIKNSTTASTHDINFAVSAADFTGNSSSVLMYRISFANASANPTYTVSVSANGISNAAPWYTSSVDVAYVFAGTLLIVFGVLALPFHDLSISKMSTAVQKSVRSRPNTARNTYRSTKPAPKRSTTGKKRGGK
jgi:hypothetical protein